MNLSEVQIDQSRLVHNVRALRTLLAPGVGAIAVVKGNAYGHGLAQVVEALGDEVDGFQVDDIEELRSLRAWTNKRALVLGYIGQDDIPEALQLDAELGVSDPDLIRFIAQAGGILGIRPKLHLEIDALLGRLGILPRDLHAVIDSLRDLPNVDLVAAYAHFANIEDTTDMGHAYDQLDQFEKCWQKLRKECWPNLGRHVSATSGAMTIEHGNSLVRFGLGIYGLYPSVPLARRHDDLDLRPALRWVSHLAQVKTLPAHHPVGYGLTFITPREMRIGVVPQGYADGYDRGLSNTGEVLVQGNRCAVLGRIAMNMFAVDLTEAAGATVKDEVVLLGEQGGEEITAEELAARLGTINYEITTRISPLVPRRSV